MNKTMDHHSRALELGKRIEKLAEDLFRLDPNSMPVKELIAKLHKLQEESDKIKKEQDELQKEVDDVLNDLQNKIKDEKQEIAEKDARISELQKECSELTIADMLLRLSKKS
jgi:predicted transcriptional regulator